MTTVGIVHSGNSGHHDAHIAALENNITTGGVAFSVLYGQFNSTTMKTHFRNLIRGMKAGDVLVAAGGTVCAEAAWRACAQEGSSLPVVFTSASHSFTLPDNITGVYPQTVELDATRLSILYEFLPDETTFGELVAYRPNPSNLGSAAAGLGLTLDPPKDVTGGGANEFDNAFKDWHRRQIKGVVVAANPFLYEQRGLVAQHANQHGILAIYQWSDFLVPGGGGAVSYGTSLTDAYAMAGTLVDQILKDPKHKLPPPVEMTDPQLSINPSILKKLNIPIPRTIQSRINREIK